MTEPVESSILKCALTTPLWMGLNKPAVFMYSTMSESSTYTPHRVSCWKEKTRLTSVECIYLKAVQKRLVYERPIKKRRKSFLALFWPKKKKNRTSLIKCYSILISVIWCLRLLRRKCMSTTGCSPTGAPECLREPISASDCSRVAWTVRAWMGAHGYSRTFVKTTTARVRPYTHLRLWSRWRGRQLENS